mmetsp:Transcript_38895/g.86508  ORF Transcript_38895/g.86508 Transcript_38895/m.86508 type:complete len:781 (+) Transcript_38895:79-2421(+)|eukprot:CAMPEP_0202898388 /NCGR_PEP_ID=MMETSP1392-20130828/6925_1 /ASSEMBLY_ACC=CAM_ASM_000868 /TAXON_ID=225041 /ORGANISM="Chlamydomonas chlamydogama, Strain SAG 11-48b" /LENGTH=780 /DNA_ID=CAMNT_0049584299 /DNA_START=78 /DNA_END=2420 /DNA_ORIENTATION=+
MADDEITLRPITLRPAGAAGGNPFSLFGKGAGYAAKNKKVSQPSATADDTEPKKDGERVKYTKEFMMQFMEKYNKPPVELQQLNLEIVITGETERDQQRQLLLKVAEEIDDRDWRVRANSPPRGGGAGGWSQREQREKDVESWEHAPRDGRDKHADKPKEATKAKEAPQATQADKPAPAAPTPAPAAATATTAAPAAAPGEEPKIVRAADVGLQAYRPGAAVSTEERALRQIKGILNKLTPEKFERLLQQLLVVITTADILKQTITLVFENAVEQPTYCAMYAELCLRLSKELPSFPPPAGGDRPITFAQILLNTCQDEFEGAEAARDNLKNMPGPEREDAERQVKKRVMGNMRLISELYKLDMAKDWIMMTCMEELLLSREKGKAPPEDSIEAACEMISTAGARLSKSENEKTRKKLDEVFRQLSKLEADKNVPSRIRFIIKDLQDLRRSNWIPRREVFTAKKLDEVRAQAEAELGMISSTIAAALPTLPAQQRFSQVDDFVLIPPLRGGAGEADGGWGFPTFGAPTGQKGAGAKSFAGNSALLGDYQPMARPGAAPAAPAAAPAAASASRPAAAPAANALPEEELKRKTENLFAEYVSTLDKSEAETCVRELESPAFMPKVVETCLEAMMNSMKDKDTDALEDLLIHLLSKGLISTEDLITGLATYTVQLEDLSLDVPKAPALLGHAVGSAVAAGILTIDALPQLLEGDYGAEPKRNLAAAAFKQVKAKLGEGKLKELCTAGGVKAGSFLEADPQLDGDLPSTEDFLKAEGLAGAVPL